MPPQSKRALANDAEKSPRPPKRGSPSDTTSPPPNTYSNMVRHALSTIGDYTYFDREMSSVGSPDQEDSNYLFSNSLQSPDGPPAVGLGNPYGDATNDNECFDPAESPSVFMQKHLPAYEHATPSPPPSPVQPLLSSSPLDNLARVLAAAKTTKLPNSSDDDLMEDATPTRPQRRAGFNSDEELAAADELLMDEPQMEPLDLTQLSPQERQEYYKSHFGSVVMELKDADYPPDCYVYPILAEEIWSAYLQHVTFTVTIWTNYDSSFRRFFLDQRRIQDCGKPYLSPKQGKRLEKLLGDRQLGSVRLLVGTAFRTLCELSFLAFYDERAGYYTLEGNGNMVHDDAEEHRSLVYRLKGTYQSIMEDGLTGDRTRTGLTLEDLHEIAKDFVYTR